MLFEEKQHGKALDVTLQILSGLTAAVLLATGTALLAGYMDAQFEAWAFTPDVPAMIGILEITGAFALLFRRTAGWSAVGLMVLMAAAIGIHAVDGDWMRTIPPAVMLVVLALIAWGRGLPTWTRAPRPMGTGMEPHPQGPPLTS
jgi:hypothetical protein